MGKERDWRRNQFSELRADMISSQEMVRPLRNWWYWIMRATHALKMLIRLNTNNILQISSAVSVSVTGIV